MTEHLKATMLRRLVKAIEQGDLSEIASLVAENAVFHLPGETSASGEGREAILALLGGLTESTGGLLQVPVYEVFEGREGEARWRRIPNQAGRDDTDARSILGLRVEGGTIVEIWQRDADDGSAISPGPENGIEERSFPCTT